MTQQSKIFKLNYSLIFILLFFTCLGLATPLTGDDWTWGSQIGMHRLLNGYIGYNGRILSNTLEVIISRLAFVRIPIYAVINTLLVYFSVKIVIPSEKIQNWHYLFSTGLFLTISTAVFSQSFGWFAGFINYILGMVLIFIYLYWIMNDRSNSEKHGIINYFLLFILGLSSALIIEHVTFYLWCLSLGSVFYLRKNRTKLHLDFSYILGLIIGSLIMFLNPVYIRIFTGQDSFRHTADHGIINQAITMYTNQMSKYVFQQNGVLLILLSVGLIILMFQNRSGNSILKWVFSLILLGYSFFSAFIRNLFPASNFNVQTIDQFLAILSIVYVATLVLTVLCFIKNNNLNYRLIFYIISALLLSAPFVAITPYGPRCAFNTVSFIVIAVIDISNTLISENLFNLALTSLAKTFGILSMLFILTIMCANGYISHSRSASIQSQLNNNSSTIYVRKLPFEQFVWDSSPKNTRFQYSMYKKRMHINNRKLVFIPFNKWNNIHN